MTTGLVFKSSLASMGSVNVQAKATVASTQALSTVTLNASTAVLSKVSTSIAVAALKSPLTQLVPPYSFSILPAFKSPYALAIPVDTRLQDKEPGPDVRFSPYEELTGVSKVRPEILLVTNFQPLYDVPPRASADGKGRKDTLVAGLNPVGEFLDAQVQLQHLKHESMVKLINDMKAADPDVAQMLTDKEGDFKFHISNLTTNVNYLFNTVQTLERLRQGIDIKNTPSLTYETMVNRFFTSIQNRSITQLFDITSLNNLTFQTVLADRGFNTKNVGGFTSTKTFLQTLVEINSLVKGNSYNLLGISPSLQQADTDPVYINKHVMDGFVFTPDKITTVPYTSLVSTSKSNVLSNVNSIKSAYDALFTTTNFQSVECRMAFLSNFISHEFSFSRALAADTTRTFIRDTFGYPISDTFSNEQLFDVVLGDIGDKIVDRSDNYSANSISTIANKVINDVSVMAFEPDYIEFEQSVHTPGSSYFVDEALKISTSGFNVANMQSFSTDLNNCLNRFVSFAKNMNFLPVYKTTKARGYLGDQMQQSRLFFEYMLYSFVDQSTGLAKSSVMASDLPGVFNIAQKDNYLKSLLFMYVFLKVYGATSATGSQALETVITEIDNRVNGRLGSVSAFQVNDLTSVVRSLSSVAASAFSLTSRPTASPVPRDSISTELKELRNTSDFLNSVFNLFRATYDSFLSSSSITTDGSTRYGHVQNVVLMMLAFDLVVNIVSTYVPKQFVGQFSTKTASTIGKTFYSTTTKTSAVSALSIGRLAEQSTIEIAATAVFRNPVSINTVKSKLDFEVNSLIKLTFMIISALASMKDKLDATSKSLQSSASIKQLNTILNILGDSKLLSLTMTEQQILLIKSMLDDINDKIKTDLSLKKAPGSVDFEQSGPDRDDIALLDDAVIPGDVKNALLSLFANDRFSSAKGRNIRLLTVGVPSGMAAQLRQKVMLDKIDKNALSQKQVDVIRVNVYKVDVEHQDLVFKPQSFVFELSRFVPRTGLGIQPFAEGATVEQVLDAMPTRDYSLLSNANVNTNSAAALQASDYDFLSDDQKAELPRNHAMSYFLDLYIRLLTGVNTAEYDLVVDPTQVSPSPTVQPIIDAAVDHIVSKAAGTPIKVLGATSLNTKFVSLPNPLPAVRGIQTLKLSTSINIAKLQPAFSTLIAASSQVVDTTKRAKTVYTDNTAESKRLFTPKLFDRVFSVAVDPDDYEIDSTETLKTTAGKEAFDKLLKQGMILQVDDQSTFFASALAEPRYKLRERDINESDLTFEKYFVTFDTVFDEVV